MTNRDKINYLNQYNNLIKELKESQLRYKELHSIMTSIPAQKLTDMPRGATSFDKMTEKLIQLESLSDNRTEILDKLEKIEKIIDNIEDPFKRRVMKLRYLDGLAWNSIAHQMHNAKSWVQKVHGNIISNLDIQR